MKRPMLACKITGFEKLRYPLIAQPKLDGVRMLVATNEAGETNAYTRTGKPFGNSRLHIMPPTLDTCDGELVSSDGFRDASSKARREGADVSNLTYCVFDSVYDKHMTRRLFHADVAVAKTQREYADQLPCAIHALEAKIVTDAKAAEEAYNLFLTEGFEGIILRDPLAPYKHGRSTQKEQALLKRKPVDIDVGTIIGVVALEKNLNEAMPDELGYTKRSSAKEGKVTLERLGALTVRAEIEGTLCTFNIGTGFSEWQRATFWKDANKLVGREVQFKHEGLQINAPRFPVFFRLLK